MKRSVFIMMCCIIAVISCSKESFQVTNGENVLSPYGNKDVAMQDFSKILSKALYNEPDLRVFLKEEALKEFDRDYDVFYPWIKDVVVINEKTFREIIKQYDDNSCLENIEAILPRLNILVPDWSWIDPDCFSVKTWNTDIKEVGVSYRSFKEENEIYANGKSQITLPAGVFPEFPVVIVKENERMIQTSVLSKSGTPEFAFADPCFDGTNSIKTKGDGVVIETYNFTVEETTNEVPLSELPYRLGTAYAQTNNVTGLPQRDHIYYNMTATQDSGVADYDYSERLYKFRFTKANVNAIFDDPIGSSATGNDYKLKDYWINTDNTSNIDATWYTKSQLAKMDWGEGNIEMKFEIYAGDEVYKQTYTLSFHDVFAVKRVYQKREENWLGANMYRHYYTKKDYLQPKWVILNQSLFTWNLKDFPTRYQIVVKEFDHSNVHSHTINKSFSYATNFSFDASLGIDVKLGWEFGISNTTSQTSTYTETYEESTDEIGSQWVHYADNVILSQSADKALIKTYSIGDVEMMLLPKYL